MISNRRKFGKTLAAGTAALAATASPSLGAQSEDRPATETSKGKSPFRYCLNTSTIHGEVIPIVEQIAIAQKAGYDGIEVWLRDVDKFLQEGKPLSELRKRLDDSGLALESAIAFANWIVDDDAKRGEGLKQARREMETVVALGGKRIAAPPAGATNGPKLDLEQVAARYRDLLEVGDNVGCLPMLEVWGFSTNLHKVSEVLYVAAGTQHPKACILADVYHFYKGGSNFQDLHLLAGSAVPVLHMNDYPDIPRDKINDADRVYPGDGIAPVREILATLKQSGFQGILSLELFNRTYWQQDPLEVAKTGLRKMKEFEV